MTVSAPELVTQLNMLLRLTVTEAATARARVSQATTQSTTDELLTNAANCDERATAIRTAITDLNGVPDVLGLAVGKALAVGKLPLEQAMPITEALLADLTLEHQLFDRARLVKVLAEDAGQTHVVGLAHRLEEAHGETIQWLFTVLAETAIGGPAALAPTPTQAAAGTVRSTITYGSTVTAKAVNRLAAALSGATTQLRSTTAHTATTVNKTVTGTVDSQLARAKTLAGSATKVFTAGRDATLRTAEDEAAKTGHPKTAEGLQTTREDLGAVEGTELPIPGYDTLLPKGAADAIRELTDAHDVSTVLAYETAHKARTIVMTAARDRVTELASEVANS